MIKMEERNKFKKLYEVHVASTCQYCNVVYCFPLHERTCVNCMKIIQQYEKNKKRKLRSDTNG